MTSLNLPRYDMRLRRSCDGSVQVYDLLRDKWVALTPEEWVRQHFVNYLLTAKGYPRYLTANEVSLKLNATSRRCDTVVFDRERRPLVIVEYKAPTVAITQKVFDQIARYNSVLRAPVLIVSNGLQHYSCRFDGTGYTFLKEIPSYTDAEQLSE
ncbi:MAG: type I restriction enzyme HsdR N-terminal domain-containing protein [Muribaculaceae bacterium]